MTNWKIEPRFSDFFRNLNHIEQKLDDVIQYVNFLRDIERPVILMKDGSLLLLFRLDGIDYEGLSEEIKEDFSYFARSALEQLPDEGAGFMLSNILIRDTPKPDPLIDNPDATPIIRFAREKKQAFWNDVIQNSFSNRILCGLRYFPVEEKIESIKEEEAFALATDEQIKARRNVLEKLKESNEALATDDEASALHLQAMQNRIQMEIAAMMLDTNLVEQRQRRLDEEINNYFMELQEMLREAQQNDAQNIEYILNTTTTN